MAKKKKTAKARYEVLRPVTMLLPPKLVREFSDDSNFPGEIPLRGQTRMRRALWEDMERRKRERRTTAA